MTSPASFTTVFERLRIPAPRLRGRWVQGERIVISSYPQRFSRADCERAEHDVQYVEAARDPGQSARRDPVSGGYGHRFESHPKRILCPANLPAPGWLQPGRRLCSRLMVRASPGLRTVS